MSIELEVGQVRRADNGYQVEIVGVWQDAYGHRAAVRTTDSGIVFIMSPDEIISLYPTLITNADDGPYVAPVPKNDYQSCDIWDQNGSPVLIDDEGLCFIGTEMSEYRRIRESALFTDPQQYRLIYRDGEVVTND